MVAHVCNSSYLGRLRQENHLNLGGRGFGELRWLYCTPAWATRAKLRLKKKKEKNESYIYICLLFKSRDGSWAQWLLSVIPAL